VPLSLLKKMNFRTRIAILCAFFLAPLVLLLLFQAERARSDLAFLDREIQDVAALRAIWPEVRAQTGDGERAIVERVGSVTRTVILDTYPETYHLANAVTQDLLVLALGLREAPEERARPAHRAADQLSEAVVGMPQGKRRMALKARAERLDGLADAPAGVVANESVGLWDDTIRDLADLLAERRAAMLRRLVLGSLLIGGSVALGLWLALAQVRDMARRVTVLVAQIDRLTENDTSGVTPFLDDRYDMGRIAKGVDALRLSLIDARAAWSQVLVNEMRASLLSDHARAVVLRTNRDGVVVFSSPACAELDFDPEELEGTSVWDLFEPGDRDALSHATPKAAGEMISRRRRRLARRFGATELWDVEVSLPEEATDGFVFLLKPAAS
jgi:PAS domain-containing protein